MEIAVIEGNDLLVSENHPYDVCEVITTSIEGGNKEYIDWIGKVVPQAKM